MREVAGTHTLRFISLSSTSSTLLVRLSLANASFSASPMSSEEGAGFDCSSLREFCGTSAVDCSAASAGSPVSRVIKGW